jgi:hypothetical protein
MTLVTIDLPKIHQDIILDDHRYKVIKAGRGFAKSGILLAEAIKDLTVEYRHPTGQLAPSRIIYGAPTYKDGRDIIWERAKEFLEPFRDGRANESRLEIPLINRGLFVIKGCNDPDSLRGPYATKFLGDEFAFHLKSYFMRIIDPMLVKIRPVGTACFASTPNGFNEFEELYQKGIQGYPDWKSWKYTSLEGGFIQQEEIEKKKEEMTFAEWRQEYFAETLMPTDSVYYAFSREKHNRKISHVPDLTIHWAWDFNVKPAVHSVLSHEHKGKLFAFDEICVGNTPDNVEEFCKRYPKDKVAEIKLYGDYNGTLGTNGTTDYMEIQSRLVARGYPMPELCVYGGNPIVRSRTNNVNRLFEDASGNIRVYVDTAKCPRLTRDFEKVRWSKKGADIDKTSNYELSHASDAIGYQLYVMFPPIQAQDKKTRPQRVLEKDEKGWILGKYQENNFS